MWRIFALIVLVPTLVNAEGFKHAAKNGTAPPLRVIELYCTDTNGERHELGEVMCLNVSSCQQFLAKCDMSLNNVMWRQIQEGCPAASAEPALIERLNRLRPLADLTQSPVKS